MANAIFPSEATRRRVPRFAFPDCSPQLYGLDDELCRLMEQYAAYLHDTTGECWTLGELAQELTMRALGEEDTWDFWAWIIKTEGQAEATYYLPRPSWHFRSWASTVMRHGRSTNGRATAPPMVAPSRTGTQCAA